MGGGVSAESNGGSSSDAAYQKYLEKMNQENDTNKRFQNTYKCNNINSLNQTTLYEKSIHTNSANKKVTKSNVSPNKLSEAPIRRDGIESAEQQNVNIQPLQQYVHNNNNYNSNISNSDASSFKIKSGYQEYNITGESSLIGHNTKQNTTNTDRHYEINNEANIHDVSLYNHPKANNMQPLINKQTKKVKKKSDGGKNDDIFKRMISKYYNITTDTKVVAPKPPVNDGNLGLKGGQSASECHWSAYNGNVNKLESLLDLQDESQILDSLGRSALFYGACQGHYDVCAFLIDHRHEWANMTDRKGDTPMHVASYYQHHRIVELLVQSAVDVSIRNEKGFIPLHVTESVETLKILIEYGSDVMSVCKKGRTPLFCAAAMNRLACLKHLCGLAIQHPRMVNLADHRGDTALHAAAANGNVQCVILLLEVAANANSKNVRGLTPRELAERNNHSAVLELFKTEIASTDSNGSNVVASINSHNRNVNKQQFSPTHKKALNEVYKQPVAGYNKYGNISERNYSNYSSSSTSASYVNFNHNKNDSSARIDLVATERLPLSNDKDISKLQAILHQNDTTSRSSSTVQNDSYRDDEDDDDLKRLQSIVNTPGRVLSNENQNTNLSGDIVDDSLKRLQSVINTPGRVDYGNDTDVERLLKVVNSSREDVTDHHNSSKQQQWIKTTDPNSGHVYYQNSLTGESQWEKPY